MQSREWCYPWWENLLISHNSTQTWLETHLPGESRLCQIDIHQHDACTLYIYFSEVEGLVMEKEGVVGDQERVMENKHKVQQTHCFLQGT